MIDSARRTKPVKPLTLLQRVHQASRAISAARDERAVGEALMTFAATGGVHAARLLIFQGRDGKIETIEMREGWTIDDRPAQPYGTQLPVDRYPLIEFITGDELLICENVKTDERLNEATRQIMRISGLESFAVIPLTSTLTENWLGAVIVGRDNPSTFDQEFVYAWWTLAGQAAAAFENLQLLERIDQDRQRYWDLYNRAPACYFSTGPDGTLLEFNDTGLKWLGYARDDLIGKKRVSDMLTDRGQTAFLALFPRLKKEGHLTNVELELKRRDGSTLSTLIDATALYDEHGHFIRSRIVARDITQLRQMEQRQRQLARAIEASADAIAITDPDGTIQFVNPAFEYITGYSAAEALGQNPRIFKSGVQDEAFYREMWNTIKAGQVWRGELINKRRDGTFYNIQLVISPVLDDQGEVIQFVAIQRDVTGQRQIEAEREKLLADLEQRAIQLQTAAEISRAASSILDPQTLIQQSVELIRERFALYYVGLFLVDDASEWAVLQAGTGEAGRLQIEKEHRLRVGGESMIGQCISTAEPRIALDVGDEAHRFDNPYLPHTRSEMALPLISRGQVIGAMTIQSAQEAAFSQEDTSILQTMADQLANAIQNARLFDDARQAFAEQQRRSEELSVLNELSQALTAKLNVSEVIEQIYHGISRLMDTTSFYIALYDAETDGISFPLAIEAGERVQWSSRQSGKGLTEYVIHSRKPVLIEENLLEWLADKEDIEAIGREALSWLGVPMAIGDQVIGVIAAQSYETPRLYGERERDLLMSIANQAAIAIQNANLFSATEQAYREQARRSEEMAVINALGQALSATLDVDQVLHETYRGVSRLLDTTNFYIALYDPQQQQVAFRLNVTESEIDREITVLPANHGITGYIIQNRTSVLIPSNVTGWLEEHGLESVGEPAASWLGVPLMIGEQIIGVMAIQDYHTPGLYDEHDREVLTTIANQVAIAIQNARLYQRTQTALIESQKLYQATRQIGQALELEPLVQEIASAARHLTDANYSVVLTLAPQTGAVEYFKTDGVDLERYPVVKLPEGKGLLAPLLQGQIIRTEDIATHPDAAGLPTWHFPIQAILGVPLMRQDQVHGIIVVGNIKGQRTFTEQDERLLGTFVAQAVTAIENRRLLEAEAQRRQEAESLQQVATALTSTLDLVQVFDLVLEHLSRLLAYDSATIFLVEGSQTVVQAAKGLPDASQVLGMKFDIASDALFQQLQNSVQPIIIADAQTDPRFRALGDTGYVRGWMGVPLISKGEVIGSITIDSRRPNAFDAHDAALALALANQAAVAIENTRLFEETQRALQEVEATHRQYLREQWDEMLSAAPDRTWGYVDSPDGLMPAGDFWKPEVEQAIESGEPVARTATDGNDGQEARSALAVPLMLRGQTIGVLDFYDEKRARPWTEDDKALVAALAGQLAQALETQRLFEQTQRRALREQLTAEIVNKIRAAGDIHSIIETTAQELGRALGVSRARVTLGPVDSGHPSSENNDGSLAQKDQTFEVNRDDPSNGSKR